MNNRAIDRLAEQAGPAPVANPSDTYVPVGPADRSSRSAPGRRQAQPDFERRFHRFNLAGSVLTAASTIGCGLGSFAHIGEDCHSIPYIRGKCTGAGFGMGGVIVGIFGVLSGIGLAASSLYRGEGRTWRRWNSAISILNLTAAMASGGPAMYAFFNNDNPDVCGNGHANDAAFAGFWISVASAGALAIQSMVPHRNRLAFGIVNATNTSLSAVAAVLAAAPDLCATNQTVHHRGGGQATVAVINCLGVVCGVFGGLCSAIGAFA